MNQNTTRKANWVTIVGYGAGDLFMNGAMAVVSTWMLFFYVNVGGLSAVAAGSILAIARVADSLISPLMGYITDHFGRTKLGKRFGRRRFFLLLGIPLLLFYVSLWIGHMNYWYYLLTYIVVEAITALVGVPYETLAAEMSDDYEVKSRLSSSRMLWAALATFLASWLPGRVFKVMGEQNQNAFLVMGVLLAVVFAVAIGITYFTTFERQPSAEEQAVIDAQEKEKANQTTNPFRSTWSVLKEMGSVFRIKAYALHLVIYLTSFTARDIIGATYVFFVVYAMQMDKVTASNLLTFGSIIGIPMNLIWPKVMAKLGPSRLLQIMYGVMFLTVGAYAVIYVSPIVGSGLALTTLYALQMTWGISNSGTGYVPWTVYTFIPDVDELITKQRREGLFAGIMTFCRKTTSALAPFLTGIVLQAAGFDETATTQTVAANNGLVLWMLVGSGVLLACAFATTLFFHLNKQNHVIIRKEIDRLHHGGRLEDMDAQTRRVAEDITGMKIAQLWGNNTIAKQPKAEEA